MKFFTSLKVCLWNCADKEIVQEFALAVPDLSASRVLNSAEIAHVAGGPELEVGD